MVYRVSSSGRLIIEQIIVAWLIVARWSIFGTILWVVDDGGCSVGDTSGGLLSAAGVGLVLVLLGCKRCILRGRRLILVPGLWGQGGSVPGGGCLGLLP